MNKTLISRFLCYLLRHDPEAENLSMDKNGWVNADQLIEVVRKVKCPDFDRAALDDIVATDNKQRYSYSEDGRFIRTNQGHSVAVDVELPVARPPEYLWHGTCKDFVESIDRTGLSPQSRLHVHLSADIDTARNVGVRHGEPFIYRVRSGDMARAGYTFYRSVNGVWLTDAVPAEYLEKPEDL